MKRLLLLLTLTITTTFSLFAQRVITGHVVDSEQQEAVIQATVSLLKTDSTTVVNTVTNNDGDFRLTAPSNGRFLLRISYIGSKTLYHNVNVSGDKPLALGTLKLSPDSKMLKEVEVVKNLAKVTTKADTIIYNAGAYRTPEGSVVEELVKKLPGAEVSDDGTIKINGKEVKKIRVDGKEFMTGDTKTAIKNLPTSIVERIKTYDEKSDLSRVTGIDDGNETTVLDFGLKRGMNRGMFANVDLGIGTESRYQNRGMGALMKDDLRAMAFGSANNTNDRGFGGGGGGGPFGGGGRNGLQSSKMIGVNLNYEKKDVVKADGSVRWNHNDGDSWSKRSSENFVSTTGSFSNSINQNYSRSDSWNAQGRVEWTPDTLWNISFRPTFRYSNNDGTSWSQSATFSQDPYNFTTSSVDNISETVRRMLGIDSTSVVNDRQNSGLSYSDSKSVGASLQVNRKLGGRGRNITFQAGGNYSEGTSESLSHSLVQLYQLATGDSAYQKNRYNVTPQKNYNYNLRLTYSEPIFTATFLQFSYNFEYKYTKSDRSTYDFWNQKGLVPRYSFEGVNADYREWDSYFSRLEGHHYSEFIDNSLSRFSEYKNYIHTGEIMLRVIREAYNFNVGVQVIPQQTEFSYRYLTTDTVTSRNVINWSPTANFRWKLSERGQMRFTYRGSTSQPSMTDLLPITDNSDPLNITMGNPSLKPAFTQSFNWRFNNFYERHQRFIFANARFSTTSNSVSQMVTYDEKTGGRTSQPQNINGNWNAGGSFVMNTALDTLGTFNVSTHTDVNYSNHVGYLYLNTTHETAKNTTRQTTLSERLGTSFRNDWLEVELNGGVTYNYATNKLQPQSNLKTWAFNYGFNTTMQAPWGMQFTTSLNMSSRRGYSDASLNTNELIWNAQISQGFLKGKPLTIMLQFYDILREQSNLSRTINAMSRTDTEYNSINSYVMLHAVYRLNLFGTKEARREMRRAGRDFEGGPGMPPGGGRGNRNGGRGGRGGFGGGGFGGRM